jgi:very-short-patch-repair endonuclease
MTEAECFLWKHIRNKKLGGLRFRRQVSIGYYIIDFYCAEKRLAVEVDGKYHIQKEVQKHDAYRADFLTALGISVVRFSNEEVMNDIDAVCRKIIEALPSGITVHLQ